MKKYLFDSGFILKIFIRHLVCARCWGHTGEQDRQDTYDFTLCRTLHCSQSTWLPSQQPQEVGRPMGQMRKPGLAREVPHSQSKFLVQPGFILGQLRPHPGCRPLYLTSLRHWGGVCPAPDAFSSLLVIIIPPPTHPPALVQLQTSRELITVG